MSNQFGLVCPSCETDDGFTITYTGTCRVMGHEGTEDIGDHDWDSSSMCVCPECGYRMAVSVFEPKETEE